LLFGALGVTLLLLLVTAALGWILPPPARVPLTDLYTPHFAPAPAPEPAALTLSKAWNDFAAPGASARLRSLLPSQSGVLCLSLLVAGVVAFDFRRLRNPRNVDLLLLLAIGASFHDILRFGSLRALQDPTNRNLMDWVFSAVAVLTITLLARALMRVFRPARGSWAPNVTLPALAVLALSLFALDVAVALAFPPDDAGYYINVGAQRLIERQRLPYGDPLLTATPSAAYGPILYLAHAPFQFLLAPGGMNAISSLHPPLGAASTYYLPPMLATKLCVIAFHALGVLALFVAARSMGGVRRAWGLVALYCGSAFVLGVGGSEYFIGGMTFASHIAPASVTLLAFAALGTPVAAGVLLATGVGVLFYPVFMLPAWLGYYWSDPKSRWRFLAGFAGAAILIGVLVLSLSRPAGGRGLLGTILYDTVGHQESAAAYGSSPFGLWGQREGLRAVFMRPLVADQSLARPLVLVCFLFSAAGFYLARNRRPAQLALLTAVIAIGAQLWKIHATATYVAWYYPFLLLGLFGEGGTPSSIRAEAAVRSDPDDTLRSTLEGH